MSGEIYQRFKEEFARAKEQKNETETQAALEIRIRQEEEKRKLEQNRSIAREEEERKRLAHERAVLKDLQAKQSFEIALDNILKVLREIRRNDPDIRNSQQSEIVRITRTGPYSAVTSSIALLWGVKTHPSQEEEKILNEEINPNCYSFHYTFSPLLNFLDKKAPESILVRRCNFIAARGSMYQQSDIKFYGGNGKIASYFQDQDGNEIGALKSSLEREVINNNPELIIPEIARLVADPLSVDTLAERGVDTGEIRLNLLLPQDVDLILDGGKRNLGSRIVIMQSHCQNGALIATYFDPIISMFNTLMQMYIDDLDKMKQT